MPNDLSFYMQMLDTNPGFIWRTRADGRFRYWNRTWQDFSGLSTSAAGESNWLDVIHPEDKIDFENDFDSAHKNITAFTFEIRVRRADGIYRPVLGKAEPMRASDGLFDGLSFLMMEYDNRPRFANLSHPMNPVTGLPDTEQFLERLSSELEKANRYNIPLSLIRVDINGITPINDIYGFDAGDAVLLEFADVLKLNIRSYDLACRYENDDFLVLFTNTRIDEAQLAMQHIVKAAMDMVVPWDNLVLKVSISYGVTKRLAGDTTENLLSRAKDALHKNKTQAESTTDEYISPYQPNDALDDTDDLDESNALNDLLPS